MRATTVDVSMENAKLGSLKSIRLAPGQEQSWVGVPNASLPAELKADLQIVYEAIFGEELPAEDTTLRVRVRLKDGRHTYRIFGPAFYCDQDGKPMIRWGSKHAPVTIGKKGVPSVEGASEDLELAFAKHKVGRYEEACLVAVVTSMDAIVTMPIPIKPADYGLPIDAAILAALLKQGQLEEAFKPVAKMSADGNVATTNSSSQLPTHGMAGLEPGVVYKVVSAKRIKTRWGPSYMLRIAQDASVEPSDQFVAMADLQAGDINLFSAKPITQAIDAGAKLPLMFSFTTEPKADGTGDRQLFDVQCEYAVEAGGLDLSFLKAAAN